MVIWSIMAPGHSALELIAPNERAARTGARKWLSLNKLPKGTLVMRIQ